MRFQSIYNFAPVVVALLLLLVACGTPAPLLNSERIEERFGSYGVDIVRETDFGRLSSLYSLENGSKIARTIAAVEFAGPPRAAYAAEHERILDGRSIGATLQSAGWHIDKQALFIGEFAVGTDYELISTLMQVELPQDLAAHVYLLVITAGERSFRYATITEIHHPEYLTSADLQQIYGEILFDDSQRTGIDDFVDPGLWKN